jgi:dCTP deaminase
MGIVQGSSEEYVNSSSIDLTLGKIILVEAGHGRSRTVRLKERDSLNFTAYNMEEQGPFTLQPGQFVLAHTKEVFALPRYLSAEYKLKSSMARMGLEHLNAGWCDPGWNGSVLTLELKNMTWHHNIVLEPGVRIGQMVFFDHEPVPANFSYDKRGTYNGDESVSPSKPMEYPK